MDGQRFDEIARLIGAGSSRRRLLKGLAGGTIALAGLSAATGSEAAVNSTMICCLEPCPDTGPCCFRCSEQPSDDRATITIHVATCPTGVGPGIFDQCHGNVQNDVSFSIDASGLQPTSVVTVTSDGDGVATTSAPGGAVTITEEAATFGAYLGAYVYCSGQKSGVVLLDTDAPGGTVTFTAFAGDDIVCDWYNITEAVAATSPVTPPTTAATTLPSTGVALGDAGNDSGLGTGLVAAAGITLAVARKLRASAVEPGA